VGASTLSAQGTEAEQEKEEKYISGLEAENDKFFDEISRLEKENKRLREDLGRVYFEHYGRIWNGGKGPYSPDRDGDVANNGFDGQVNKKDGSATDGQKAGGVILSELRDENVVFKRRIALLERQIDGLRRDLEKLQIDYDKDKESFANRLTDLTTINSRLSKELAQSQVDLSTANRELEKSARLVRCTREFYAKNQEVRNAATEDLELARIKYERYTEVKSRNTTRYDDEIREILDFIFDTYDRYDDRPMDQDCGDGVVVKDVISFMDARDHLNLATILAADPRHLINRYKGGIDQRTAAINAELIYQLSQVFSKQYKFSDLRMSKRIADNLPDLMQKVPNALASSATLNPQDSTDKKIEALYADVAYEYKQKRYSNALGLYNRYQRLEGESHLMGNDEVRAGTMTSVGIILLFNLGDVGGARGIPLKGTYLEKAFNNRQREGIKLLKQVLTFRDEDGSLYPRTSEVFKWQKRAAYAMSKYYYPAGKIERQRNREAKRLNSGEKLKQGQIERSTVEEAEVEQAKPRRFTITPSFYPYRPIQQNYYRNNGDVGIELDGSGLEGSLQIAYYKPGNGFTYGMDLGYSQQYYRLDNNDIRLPPSSLSFGTAFAGPFVSYAARNIEKEFHPVLSAGLSFRYDIDRKFRLNDNDQFGDRRSILITDLPFFDRTSWYANAGFGFNRERFSLSKQRMVVSTFRMFVFLPVFNTAIQVNNNPTAFGNRYSQNFLDLGRQTIHLGFTYSKMIEVFKNGLGMDGKEMLFVNNRKKKVRLIQPIINNNASRKKIDGRFTLMTSIQNKIDSVFIPSDSSYVNMDSSVGWRAAYSLHFLGNNLGFYNQNNGYAWKKFPLYDFYVAGGFQQQLYRLSIRERYRSLRSLHGFVEGGARMGGNGFMVLLGGGYNFSLSNQAVYTDGEGVINRIHTVYVFAGVQLARFLTVRLSSRSLDIDSSESLISFKNPNLQIGFGF
jgi:hypothetical protein